MSAAIRSSVWPVGGEDLHHPAPHLPTVLVEHYDDDWSQLWWIRVAGRVIVHRADSQFTSEALAALVAKYEQYQQKTPAGPLYSVELDEVVAWRANPT